VSAFANLGAIGPQPLWAGVLGRSVHGERVSLALIEIDPDGEVPTHSHDNEQLGLLIEGSLSFTVGEETSELGPGDTWCIRPDVPHSVVGGPEGAVMVEVFAPVRDDWDALETHEPGPGRWP
jgi:quercetin dioxygenase-like cupin family protein